MAPETTKQQLASLLLGRSVAPWARERREAGATWFEIATELRDKTGGKIAVTPQTLINWTGPTPRRMAS